MSVGALVHQALSAMCPSLPKYFRSLQSQIILTQYNRKNYASDATLTESSLDSMVGLQLTYQGHVSLIFYFTKIMMMIIIINHFCLCKSNLMQWPMVLCCGFEIFKLKL